MIVFYGISSSNVFGLDYRVAYYPRRESNSRKQCIPFGLNFYYVLFTGMSSGKSSVTIFQGSPEPAGVMEGGLIDVQHQLNPSSSDSNAPGLEPHK